MPPCDATDPHGLRRTTNSTGPRCGCTTASSVGLPGVRSNEPLFALAAPPRSCRRPDGAQSLRPASPVPASRQLPSPTQPQTTALPARVKWLGSPFRAAWLHIPVGAKPNPDPVRYSADLG